MLSPITTTPQNLYILLINFWNVVLYFDHFVWPFAHLNVNSLLVKVIEDMSISVNVPALAMEEVTALLLHIPCVLVADCMS